MLTVNYDELTVDTEHCHYYQGVPFTGSSIEYGPGGVDECQFINGWKHGVATERYSSGQVKQVMHYVLDAPHGLCVEYAPDGQKTAEAEFENGIQIWSRVYDLDGNVIDSYSIENNEMALEVLRLQREVFALETQRRTPSTDGDRTV